MQLCMIFVWDFSSAFFFFHFIFAFCSFLKKIWCYFCLHFVLFACLFIHVVRSPFMWPSFLFNAPDSVGIIRLFFSSLIISKPKNGFAPEKNSMKQKITARRFTYIPIYIPTIAQLSLCMVRVSISMKCLVIVCTRIIQTQLFYLPIQRTRRRWKKQPNSVAVYSI